MASIDEIMYLLDEHRSCAEQDQGLSLAREVDCIKAFFQPIGTCYSKSVWRNCAIVVSEKNDQELLPYLPDMLLWIQDLNWPGADLILMRLKDYENVAFLIPLIERIVPAIVSMEDDLWMMSILELLESAKISNGLSQNTYELITAWNKR